MGHLIPGGTGFHMHKNIKLVALAEPLPEEKETTEADEAAEKKLRELLG